MVMLDPGQYNDKVSTMIKSGEYFDLAFFLFPLLIIFQIQYPALLLRLPITEIHT